MLTIALIESAIALVAAISLAVLNHIFVSQRQIEFGLLHALGNGRWQLVWRTLREAAFTTGSAWCLSVALCLAGLLGLRFGVFRPLGLRLNLLNLAPWLFTLPVPVAVLIASGGTSARMLASLDPIAVIEKREA
jgi:ABC-type antimicrobial peptide transport system permease subunit